MIPDERTCQYFMTIAREKIFPGPPDVFIFPSRP